MANHLNSARTQLVKETMQFARTMGDIEALARTRWGKGAGGNSTVQEYIDRAKLQELMDGFKSMAKALEAINTDLSAMEAKQAKQDINIVKASRASLRVQNIAEEVVKNEAISTNEDDPQWYKELFGPSGIKLIDPETYTKGGRIYLHTIGLTPAIIMQNEFDIELFSQKSTEWLSDSKYLSERWGTFCAVTKSYVNSSLGEFIRGYVAKRGIPYTPTKRGRKSTKNSEVQN